MNQSKILTPPEEDIQPVDSTAYSPNEYLKYRVTQYQSWYDKKASMMKTRYQWMRAFSVVGGGVVPVLININSSFAIYGIPVTQTIVTIISLLVVIVVSLESVFHFREQWKNYRSTEQIIGHERFLFCTRVGRYRDMNESNSFKLFVERVEEIISIENSSTLNVMTMASETVDSTKYAKSGELSAPMELTSKSNTICNP